MRKFEVDFDGRKNIRAEKRAMQNSNQILKFVRKSTISILRPFVDGVKTGGRKRTPKM